jgi:hypothetical protein
MTRAETITIEMPGVLSLWPAAIAAALYLALAAVLLWLGLSLTGGAFVYPQDDPYIHLAIARTLAEHGVWGIRPTEFAGASSSPLWTVLLAGLWKLGAQMVWVPLVLNLLCGILLLAIADTVLRPYIPPRLRAAVLVAMVLVTPLPTLALIGMEHTLYIVIALLLGWRLAGVAVGGASFVSSIDLPLAALLVSTRYEGTFFVAAAGVLLWIRGHRLHAVALGIAGALPMVLYGAYSIAHGGLILPNSVLMKSGPGRFSDVGSGVAAVIADWFAILNLFGRPPQLVLTLGTLAALALSFRDEHEPGTRARAFAILFLAVSALHACLVKLEWFFRYEAYLMVFGLVAVCLVIAERPVLPWQLSRNSRNPAAAVCVLVLALPLFARALTAISATPLAMRNVFEQQYQLATFLQRTYPQVGVALNDIGAVSFLATSRIVDIVGLATQDVANLKRHRRLDRNALEVLVRTGDVEAIAIYEDVFAPIIPASWILVGEWTISNNVAVSEDTVGFYAPTAHEATRLGRALDEYAPMLPRAVIYRRKLSKEIGEGGG